MKFTRWERVKELFDQAVERPPEERAAFLEEACDDPAVRAEVKALLEAEENAPSFLEEGAARAGRSLVEEGKDESGRRVGPYRLAERLGEGGMGVVYRANRADGQFEQEVAIKFLPRYFETEARVARFRAERQILADLDHPNIARLLGGGVTEEGTPYLVMEHVDGTPITDYCAERGCSLEQRLDLLQAVSAALQHAHRNLVVHRDLKPSNILVTAEGEVKLLDFGIAKLLDAEDAPPAPPATRTGLRPMTPAYAAPEQVAGEAVTTATDIYQLGVLAYELLTGTRPFDLSGKRPSEMERIVTEESPTQPSTALREVDAARVEDRALPREAARRLRGDLDRIILKALRKEPGRRYGSAELFAEDLERFQADRPVRARPATITYRATKLTRRHRKMLAGALAAVLLLVGVGIFHVNQVAIERDEAERQAATAEEAVDFMAELFESNDPYQENGDTITARELLERGEERIGELSERPAVQAELLNAMGRAHLGLGNYEMSDSLHQEALQLSDRLGDDLHPGTAASLYHLAIVKGYQGHYAAAESLQTKSLSMRRELYEPPHRKIAESLNHLGWTRQQRGALSDADSLYLATLDMQRAIDEEGPKIALTLNNIGGVLRKQGQYLTADSLIREAASIERDELGERHPRVATTLNSLGRVLRSQERYAAADSVYRKAVSIGQEALGERHPITATTLNNRGIVLRNQGRYEAADSVYREAVSIRRETLGEEHPRTATTLNNLGVALRNQGEYAEADSVYREALSIRREAFGERHPRTATTLNNLGIALRNQGEYASADSVYREALSIRREEYGERHPRTATTLNNLGVVLRSQGEYAEADSVYREALSIRRDELGERHPRTATTLGNLGRVLRSQGRYTEADSVYREALSIRQEEYGEDGYETASSLIRLADVRMEQGRAESADSLYREALAISKEALDSDDWRVARAQKKLGTCLMKQERYAEAESYLADGFDVLEAERGADDELTAEAADALVEVYEALGAPEKVAAYETRSQEGAQATD